MITRGELGHDVVDFVFAIVWTDDNEVAADGIDLGFDKAVDAAH